MKKLFTLLVAVALTTVAFSQVPEKMSFQAVIREAGGALVSSHSIGMRISILQNSGSGTAVYVETHAVSTNVNGLVSLEIGGGSPVTGTFENIDWSAGTYFLKTETDPTGGTNYTISGTNQLLAVPYAMYSKAAKTANYNDLTNKLTGGTGITINASNQIVNTSPDRTVIISGQNGITVSGTYPSFTISGTTLHSIGDSYGGGIIFYVSPDSRHGLIAETIDQGKATLFHAQNIISDPDNHSTDGKNYTDWRMPTLYELNLLYVQRTVVGGFTGPYYWSGTEDDDTDAWMQNFTNGNQITNIKGASTLIRAVRVF